MISVTVNARDFLRDFDALVEQQLPFAVATALNRTADETQQRLRVEEHLAFTLRTSQSAAFMERLVKIDPADRATKAKLSTVIRVTGPASDPAKAALLGRQIEGGQRSAPSEALGGGVAMPFFIPAQALRPNQYAVIPATKFPAALNLLEKLGVNSASVKRRRRSAAAHPVVGKDRTFVMFDKATGKPVGIYQREGLGKDNVQPLWFFSGRVTTHHLFRFEAIALRTIAERWPINLAGMLDYAIKTAK